MAQLEPRRNCMVMFRPVRSDSLLIWMFATSHTSLAVLCGVIVIVLSNVWLVPSAADALELTVLMFPEMSVAHEKVSVVAFQVSFLSTPLQSLVKPAPENLPFI